MRAPATTRGYGPAVFDVLRKAIQATLRPAERPALMAQAWRRAAERAVAADVDPPTWVMVAQAGGRGLWKEMPLIVNDRSARSRSTP